MVVFCYVFVDNDVICSGSMYLLLGFFFLMIRRPPRSTLDRSSAASDVYKRQGVWVLSSEFWVLGSDM